MAGEPPKGDAAAQLRDLSRRAVDDVKGKVLGSAALQAAEAPAGGADSSVVVSFSIDAVPVTLVLTRDNADSLLYLLYLYGRWPWVNAFLRAAFGALTRPGSPSQSNYNAVRLQQQAATAQRLQIELFPVLDAANRKLKDSIAKVLAEVAETGLDIAYDRAASIRQWLDAEQQRYGIDRSLSTFPCDKFLPHIEGEEAADGQSGSEGEPGAGTEFESPFAEDEEPESGQTEAAEGEPGAGTSSAEAGTDPEQPVSDEALQAMAAMVKALIEDLKQLFPLYCALRIAAEPHPALREAMDPSQVSWDSPAPKPNADNVAKEEKVRQERMAEPARAFATALRDKSTVAPILPGVIGVLGNHCEVTSDGQIAGDERAIRTAIYRACVEYVTEARGALGLVPRAYNSAALLVRMSEQRAPADRAALQESAIVLADTPETRAALWVLRTGKPRALDPLEADQLLQMVRDEITSDVQPGSDDDMLQAAFASQVIESYRLAWEDSQIILDARARKANQPLAAYDVSAAVLSLAGLALGPAVLLAGGAIGLYSLYHHCINQFSAFSLKVEYHEKQLLQDMLQQDLMGQVDTVNSTPRGVDELLQSVAPMVFDQFVMHLPGVGAWYAASQDLGTILGER